MNITCNRAQLHAALSLAVGVADKRSTMPALACVLLRAGKTLSIAASDLSVSYLTEVDCAAREPGALALDAKSLHDIVASLDADEVSIRAVDGKGEIRAGKSRFQVGAIRADDFPKMPDVTALKFHALDLGALRKLAAATAYCASPDLNRAHLAGVHLDFSRSVAMASDGHRAALCSLPLGSDMKGTALVPRTGLTTLVKVDGDDGEVALDAGVIYLRAGRTVVGVKTLEAEFPIRHEMKPQYFPVKRKHEVTLGREAFLATVKRVAIVTGKDSDHGVRMSVAPGIASLASKSAALGIAEDELAVGYDGKGIEFGFNATYLADALETLDGDEVTLGIDDGMSPITLRPTAENMGEEQVAIVMPQRI